MARNNIMKVVSGERPETWIVMKIYAKRHFSPSQSLLVLIANTIETP